MAKFTRKDVDIQKDEVVFQGFFQVREYQLKHRLFAGGWSPTLTRENFCRGDAAGVLLYDVDKDAVVLIEQFRVAAINDARSPWLHEIVAGIIDPGETPEEVAIRETKEEANCEIEALMPICRYYSSPGGSSETLQLFCGKINSDHANGIHGAKSEGEDIRVQVFSRKTAIEMLEDGIIRNAAAVIALQWLQLNYKKVLQKWNRPT